MPTTEQTVAGLYDNWRRGDLDAVIDTLAEDIEYTIHIPPTMNPVGGTVRGRSAAVERFEGIVRDYEILRFENGDILSHGDEAATRVRMHYRHRPSGEILETTSMHHWRIEGGKAVLLEEFHDIDTIQNFGRRCGFCA